jgi:ribonuclease P/MRP protein subunit RPP40
MLDLAMNQQVTEFTRVRQGQQPSMLDYVFTDEQNMVELINYEVPLGKSDHVCLQWTVSLERPNSKENQTKLNYWKGNFIEITRELTEIEWKSEFQGLDVEEMFHKFHTVLMHLVHKHVPVKKPVKKKKSPWVSSETVKQIRKRGDAWTEYRDKPSDINYEKYKIIRNQVTSLVRRDHDLYQKKLIKDFKGNNKRFYGYVRNLQERPVSVTRVITNDGILTDTDKETAEVLGEYFQEVYTREATDGDLFLEEISTDGQKNSAELILNFDPDSVLKTLLGLKIDKSPGPDGIHPMILKKCASSVSTPLSLIFTQSIASGSLPKVWKLANVSPIFKKGKKTSPANYRPVSLTSVVCKVMETLVKEKVLEHLERQKVVCDRQHGFTRGRSCLTNLLEAFNEWTQALDEGYGLDVVYLDYRKAFDTVPHKRLIDKIRKYGVTGKLLRWIEDFLSGRKTRVKVNGSYSEWFEVLSGVPQGSVLGPLLFLLFVNDIPDWIKSSIRMFADDTKIWKVIKDDKDKETLQSDLDNLMKWSAKWLLKFNQDKCKVMSVGNQSRNEYRLTNESGCYSLMQTVEEKDLGIIVRNDLKPSSQCSAAASKGMSVMGLVKRNFKNLDTESFLLLYKTYIRPQLEYCVQVWSPHLQKDIQLLEKVQRKSTKLVRGFTKLSYQQRLERLGLTTLEKRRERGDLIEAYKLLTGKENIDSNQFFQLATKDCGLRGHTLKLFQQRSRLNVRKFFFSQRVVGPWNRLPQHVVDAPTVNTFKNRYDRFYRQDMDI